MTEIVYHDLPDGHLTALTHGLSLAEHPDWRHGSPELCLSVNSTETTTWALTSGFRNIEDHDVSNIQGAYPIHEVERQPINEHGIDA